MANKLDLFQLPNLDWYDDKGRIYKDALIENFNAIEAKLIEISSLDVFKAEVPDVSTITYPDVTLDSPDDKIINLKSFLNITKLANYPIELNCSGSFISKISYWTTEGVYKELRNINTKANATNKYIYLDYKNHKVISSNTATPPINCNLIGVYIGGIIKNINSMNYLGINVLYYLSRMKYRTYNYDVDSGWRDRLSSIDGLGKNGRLIGSADTNKKTPWRNSITFLDTGVK